MPKQAWPPKTADGVFATTQWTMIFDAARSGHEESSRALTRLCQSYWLPVYAFCRHRGNGPEEAKDLTQAFFVALIEKKDFAKADQEKGRFRSYLLQSVKFFLSNEHRKEQAQKRGGGHLHLSIDTEEAEAFLQHALADCTTPESLFEIQWIRVVMREAAAELRLDYARRQKADVFDALLPFVLEDVAPSASYEDIAVEQQVSVTSLRMAVSRLRQRYGEILREKIARTVDSSEEVEDEVRQLLAVLAG